ncbi:SAM-dependent methyltransferase, MidA family [Nitrosomonas sp. PY1]|uniref:class I SAM-dependent methyltransferase n=1 Tax=Nitrosomonas sp. PY1 TaxID=1803906 RepID=UPI001FC81C4A|nr:SAM-dependent methyltransferase [Nitrosomonas sp. PY1]GKS68934.1 SAM-dependent methyltransferase, MidA family [Nitrosomonas sp. PY1]
MLLQTTLPPADENALSHSHALTLLIREKIHNAGGWISFEQFMNLALYAPGLGYYNGGATKFGWAGDFTTAPEISSLFGRTLARQLMQIAEQLNPFNILEFGAGSGQLASDILLALEQFDHLPEKYLILEVSAELRERQRNWFLEKIPHLMSRIEFLQQLPMQFNGAILANEVLDAMPVHMIVWQQDQILERGVIWENEQLTWRDYLIQDTQLLDTARRLQPWIMGDHDSNKTFHSYVSEINLAARYFLKSLSQMLQQGVMLFIDYGFGRSEYYHAQRSQGTLMCHYRHHAHDDPLNLPGLQDITSHVDFSALIDAADSNGLDLIGYTTQAHFLMNCGITEVLLQSASPGSVNYLSQANQLQKLVSPAEMGELFKVIAFGKHISEPLIGFHRGDRSRLL